MSELKRPKSDWPEEAYYSLQDDPMLRALAEADTGLSSSLTGLDSALGCLGRDPENPLYQQMTEIAEDSTRHYLSENGIGRSLLPEE